MEGLWRLRKATTLYDITFILLIISVLLVGCSKEADMENATNNQTEDHVTEEENNSAAKDEEQNIDEESNQTADEQVSESEQEDHSTEQESVNQLSEYSTQEIEYARVWLNFGANQDVESLYVVHIPAGTLLNPEETDINVKYPEDVIQIRGSRHVDGVITYSGNGDGTINIYNIPVRWYGGMTRPEDLAIDDIIADREDLINNTKLAYIEPGDDDAVIELIKNIAVVE